MPDLAAALMRVRQLEKENEKLMEFVQDCVCDCYDEYGHERRQPCDRCKILYPAALKGELE